MKTPGELAQVVAEEMNKLGFVARTSEAMQVVRALLPHIGDEAPAPVPEPVKASGTVGAVVKGSEQKET